MRTGKRCATRTQSRLFGTIGILRGRVICSVDCTPQPIPSTRPRIFTAREWRVLDRGIRQRARALNAVLHDVYHRGEIVRAFVMPTPGVVADAALAEAVRAFVGERLAWYQAPREIIFVDEVPLTATGKIIRRELRGR